MSNLNTSSNLAAGCSAEAELFNTFASTLTPTHVLASTEMLEAARWSAMLETTRRLDFRFLK